MSLVSLKNFEVPRAKISTLIDIIRIRLLCAPIVKESLCDKSTFYTMEHKIKYVTKIFSFWKKKWFFADFFENISDFLLVIFHSNFSKISDLLWPNGYSIRQNESEPRTRWHQLWSQSGDKKSVIMKTLFDFVDLQKCCFSSIKRIWDPKLPVLGRKTWSFRAKFHHFFWKNENPARWLSLHLIHSD